MHIRRRVQHATSPGYTLVELMIVITIIAILLAIFVPIGMDVLGLSREAATKTTLKKVHELLQKRLEAFNRDYPDDFQRRRGRRFSPANPSDIMDRKRRFKQMFLVDANRAADPPSGADSAEVLYRLLTDTETFGTAAEDASEFGTIEVGDSDDDGNMEFLDGWGRPIRYYPYPTRLFKPGGHQANQPNGGVDTTRGATILFGSLVSEEELNRDQDDPFGVLLDQQFARQRGFNERDFHTFSTYHTPLVVSAGPDGELGLFEPNDTTAPGNHLAKPTGNLTHLDDNLTNHNTDAGAD